MYFNMMRTFSVFFLFALLLAFAVASFTTRKQCQEYADGIYEEQVSPIMLPHSKRTRISWCSLEVVPLIVGGEEAAPNEFPHMAALGYEMKDNVTGWLCGGSLISERFVLTAAHCIENEHGKPKLVRLGHLDLNIEDKQSDNHDYQVAQVVIHPFYNPSSRYNDIALVMLATPVSFSRRVRPACLQGRYKPTGEVIATGFGRTSFESEELSSRLMKVYLSLIRKDTCSASYREHAGQDKMKYGIISSQICAGHQSGGKDTCQGDSGGPLQVVLHDPYCMYSIVGITSFGKFCGYKDSPAIYTKVSAYISWIEKIVWA